MYLHGSRVHDRGFAYALKHNAHVRVDVLANRFAPRTRAQDRPVLATCCSCCRCARAFIWFSWDYVAAAWRVREGSAEVGGIPAVYLYSNHSADRELCAAGAAGSSSEIWALRPVPSAPPRQQTRGRETSARWGRSCFLCYSCFSPCSPRYCWRATRWR